MMFKRLLDFIIYLRESIKKRDLKVIIGLVVTAIILFFVILKWYGSAVSVEIAEVKRGNILTTVSASGMVESKSVKLGAASMAGRVDWVGVNEGDKVYKGQILIKLNGYDQAKKEHDRLKALHEKGFVSDLELEKAKVAADNAAIIAPISGLVTDKAVTVGEAVSVGMPIMTVVDIDNPWAEIQIDEVDIAKVRVKQRVRFTTDAYQGKEFFGHITWINKEAKLKKVGGRIRMDEEDLVFRAKVSFDNAKELKPGMSVYAEVITGEKKDVLVVLREAITLREGKRVVYALAGRRVKQIEVEVGDKDVEKVEILSGLKEGQRVAVSSLEKLRDRTRVKVK